jgi:hypothetical protein
MSHCAKCNQECYELAAPVGHEAVKHIKCSRCGDMHPMYGDCAACTTISSNAFGAKQCVSRRITFDMARKSYLWEKETNAGPDSPITNFGA